MKIKFTVLIAALGLASANSRGDLLISQYVETNSGSTPKGIEIWNSGTTTIDFSLTNFTVTSSVNGAASSNLAGASITSGTLAPNEVYVIGTSDIGTYLTNTFGIGVVKYLDYSFTFNGDDSIEIKLDGVTTDLFGKNQDDPGSAWSGSGVFTANQNIQLLEDAFLITTGIPSGFTDPSTRFTTVSTTPSALPAGLTGFGVSPIPEPSSIVLMGLVGLAAVVILRKRK